MQSENSYTETDLGNVSPNPRGNYDNSATYEYLDVVTFKGGSYLCVIELGTTINGIEPKNGGTTKEWQCLTIPGSMTQEYTDAFQKVVLLSGEVEKNATQVSTDKGEVARLREETSALSVQASKSATDAENSKDSASGSAVLAEKAKTTAAMLVTGFDTHVQGKVQEAVKAVEAQTSAYITQQKEAAKQELDKKVGQFNLDVDNIKKQVTDEGTKQVKNVQDASILEIDKIGKKGAEQVGAVAAEGVKQKGILDGAVQEIIADKEQIENNSIEITNLRNSLKGIPSIYTYENKAFLKVEGTEGKTGNNVVIARNVPVSVGDFIICAYVEIQEATLLDFDMQLTDILTGKKTKSEKVSNGKHIFTLPLKYETQSNTDVRIDFVGSGFDSSRKVKTISVFVLESDFENEKAIELEVKRKTETEKTLSILKVLAENIPNEFATKVYCNNQVEKKFPRTENIFNAYDIDKGIYLNLVNGKLHDSKNESFNSSKFIDVAIGESYDIKTKNGANLYIYEMTDKNQNTGVTKRDEVYKNGHTFVATQNTIRISYPSHFSANDICIEKSGNPMFTPSGKNLLDEVMISEENMRNLKNYVKKPWVGKKILSLGDSYTWFNYYGKYIEEVTGAKQRGRGQNGNVLKSFCNDSYTGKDGLPVTELFNYELLKDYDIVTIMGGTNDYGHGTATLGNINDDKNANTIYGSVKYLIDKILTIKPNMIVVFCTQPYRLQYSTESSQGGYAPNSNGLTMENIANAIVDCCRKYSIPCFDFYHQSGWNEFTVKKSADGKVVENIYTYDGLHPTDGYGKGAYKLGKSFGEFINGLA